MSKSARPAFESAGLRQRVRMALVAEAGAAPPDLEAVASRACERLSRHLMPIIGEGGVSALYTRSLYLIQPEFPWLAPARGAVRPDEPLMHICASFASREPDQAFSAVSAFFATVSYVLGELIGVPLAARTLSNAWPEGFHEDAPQAHA